MGFAFLAVSHPNAASSLVDRNILMFKSRAILIFSFVLGFALTSPAIADVLVRNRDDDHYWLVEVSGTITNQESKVFNKIVQELKNRRLAVKLNSLGGDVISAMRIGRTIRKLDGDTVVPIAGKCYSSCALIFISGVKRNNVGELGLHRPFLASAAQSRQEIEVQYPELLRQIKQYVFDMGITENFYEQMVNTEPSEMTIYTVENYTQLVPREDPVHQEIEMSYSARRHGVTVLEMRQRYLDAQRCITDRIDLNCKDAILWGVSEQAYLERSPKMYACYDLVDENLQVWETVPRKEMRDHLLTLQLEACQRDAILGK